MTVMQMYASLAPQEKEFWQQKAVEDKARYIDEMSRYVKRCEYYHPHGPLLLVMMKTDDGDFYYDSYIYNNMFFHLTCISLPFAIHI